MISTQKKVFDKFGIILFELISVVQSGSGKNCKIQRHERFAITVSFFVFLYFAFKFFLYTESGFK